MRALLWCLFCLCCVWCLAQEPGETTSDVENTASPTSASDGVTTGELSALEFQLKSHKEYIAILEGELKRKQTELEECRSDVQTQVALFEREQELVEVKENLGRFQNKQIVRLQTLVRRQMEEIERLRQALGE